MGPASISAAAQTPVAVRRTCLIENVIFWLFVAGLAWVPFWHGGNEAIAWGINAVLFPGLAGLYEACLMLRGRPHPVGLRHIRLPAALFLLLVLWIASQSVAGLFPDAANPVWEMAGDAIDPSPAGSISINRDLTAAALVRLITAASVFWLALQLCRDARRARTLVAAIAAVGAAYATYGLIAAKAGWLRMPDMPQGGAVSATFINPDSYAAYGGIGFLATTGLFLRLCRWYGVGASDTLRMQSAALIGMIGREGAPLLAGGFVILAALLLTGSRGGIAAAGLAIVALALLGWRGGAGREAVSWPVPVLGLVLIGGTGIAFGAALADKVADVGLFDANRLAVYRLTVQSILDRPWFGWGYGTFVDVFPMYRDGSVAGSGIWSQAHNTYLEAAQGLGIVFGSIFVTLVALLVFHCFRSVASRRENATVPLVAVGVAVLVGAHALVDFSVQMQAVALTMTALLGAGVAQSASSQVSLDDGSARRVCTAGGPPRPIRAGSQPWLTALIVLGLCGYATLLGCDLALVAARGVDARQPTFLSVSKPVAAAGETPSRWLGIPGLSPAAFDPPLAQIPATDPGTGRQRVAELTALVTARPLSSQAWLSLAVFRLIAREPLASVLAALQLSWVTGPNESSVLWQRGVFGLAMWDFLPEDGRERTARDVARTMLERLMADPQLATAPSIFAVKSAEARAQIRGLLEKQGVQPADLARLGLPAE